MKTKEEKVKFLTELLHGHKNINDIAPGKTISIRPETGEVFIMELIDPGLVIRSKRVTRSDLQKFPISKKDTLILVAPVEQYGRGLCNKAGLCIITRGIETGRNILKSTVRVSQSMSKNPDQIEGGQN